MTRDSGGNGKFSDVRILGILEWELWDEARSGAKDQDEEEGVNDIEPAQRGEVHLQRGDCE